MASGVDLRSALAAAALLAIPCGCAPTGDAPVRGRAVPEPDHVLTADRTHNKFSRTIPPALRVAPGDVVELFTKEATDGQLGPQSVAADLAGIDFDRVHPLTGPIHVEGARPGDVLTVTLHEIEIGSWGWSAVLPGFGALAEEYTEPHLELFDIPPGARSLRFAGGAEVPLAPFAGVMGVAPDTDELLSTIPPRANGGNMDNPFLTVGTTVRFPVLVDGALFSIGDTHAAQGLGEVCGTGIEAPMRIVLELGLRQGGRSIPEPEYETDEIYAVTAFATTLDEAARKATRYMVDYLVAERGMVREQAYVLTSLVGDLQIAEIVDVPHVLVSMHIPKESLP
jgi:acetamidase/formamidase